MKTGSENNAQEGRQKRAKFEISLFLIKFFFYRYDNYLFIHL